MNEPQQDPWQTWLEERAAASPDDAAMQRAKQAMLVADVEEPVAVASTWEQPFFERTWSGLALCAAALVLGLTPYVGAIVVLHQ